MKHAVTLVPGDWVGPECAEVVKQILAAAGAQIAWEEFVCDHGVLDEALLESVRRTGVLLKARTDAIRQPGVLPLTLQLRRELGLWGLVRPIQALPGTHARFPGIDLLVVREVSEGIYSGLEHEVAAGVFEAVKVTTAPTCERIARFTFDQAVRAGRKKVTIAHKSNIMKKSDGMFLRIARQVGEEYLSKGIETNDVIVDALCMRLIRNPEDFDVLLTLNLFGDIVSDLCSGLAGGITAGPSACYGSQGVALFDTPHGKAPHLVGTGKANPLPLLRAALLMLGHLGREDVADRISAALEKACRADIRTVDCGGQDGCEEVRDKLVARL